jgi:transcriptional regulator with GAF, ATPase, and Fis domain
VTLANESASANQTLRVWVRFTPHVSDDVRQALSAMLRCTGIETTCMPSPPTGTGLFVFDAYNDETLEALRSTSRNAVVLAIAMVAPAITTPVQWDLLRAGAADVLVWPQLPRDALQISARLARWLAVQNLVDSPRVSNALIGTSDVWRSLVRQVVEIAAFTRSSVLINGESGTGKELIARLIHDLSPNNPRHEMVIVDCTTISAELSGSELFGHERGAFTGAVSQREGAFELANGGTLFLDEIGELPPPLQARLLRVIQEHKYKRVGSNTWQHTDFRLVCATNRDLDAGMADGSFRRDLYFRIAGWICHTPSLRERRVDIPALARHFVSSEWSDRERKEPAPDFDDSVREYLLARDYPGNVRDLRRVVTRLLHRHTGPGPITAGNVPEDERPSASVVTSNWPDMTFNSAIRHAVQLGIGLKEIGQAATDTAVDAAIDLEQQNLHRAACRLGVTDRALQMRRANRAGAA